MHLLPKVYIIVLNYNGWNDTIECLESLLQLTYENKQILVVDNNSPDGSLEQLRDWLQSRYGNTTGGFAEITEETILSEKTSLFDPASDIVLIKAQENRGFASGNNIAMKLAVKLNDFEYLWLLNNDTVVDQNSLSALVRQAKHLKKAGKRVGICGSKLLDYYKPDTIQALGGKFNAITFTTSHVSENIKDTPALDVNEIEQDYVVGASMFVSREFIASVGLLSEDYFLYFEELDWAKRGLKNGFSLGYAYASKVYHKEGKSIGSSLKGQIKSALADYHGIRSKIIFVKKFYPEKKARLYASLAGSIVLRIGRFHFKRAKNILYLILSS